MPAQVSATASTTASAIAGAEALRQALGRGARPDHEREDEKDADHLDGLGDRDADDEQEQHRDQAERQALGLGELWVEGGEEERPRHDRRAPRG